VPGICLAGPGLVLVPLFAGEHWCHWLLLVPLLTAGRQSTLVANFCQDALPARRFASVGVDQPPQAGRQAQVSGGSAAATAAAHCSSQMRRWGKRPLSHGLSCLSSLSSHQGQVTTITTTITAETIRHKYNSCTLLLHPDAACVYSLITTQSMP